MFFSLQKIDRSFVSMYNWDICLYSHCIAMKKIAKSFGLSLRYLYMMALFTLLPALTLWQNIDDGVCNAGDLTITSILSGSIYSGTMPVERTYNGSDCLNNQQDFSVYLWDHNQQYIFVGTATNNDTGVIFDSHNLIYTGLYHITGTDLSGENYYIYTGLYTGLYSAYGTAYHLVVKDANNTTIVQTDSFIIDNRNIFINNLTISFSWENSWYVSNNGFMIIEFFSDVELSWVSVIFSGGQMNYFQWGTWYHNISVPLGWLVGVAPIAFTIGYVDTRWYIGWYLVTGSTIVDAQDPSITQLQTTLLWSGEGISFDWSFSEPVQVVMTSSFASGISTISVDDYLSGFEYQTGIVSGIVSITLSAHDIAGNGITQFSGTYMITQTGISIYSGEQNQNNNQTGNNQTGNNQQLNNNQTWNNQTGNNNTGNNSGCIIFTKPTLNSIVGRILRVEWLYNDCTFSSATLQLLDHTNQWVDLSMILGSQTGVSISMLPFAETGMYTGYYTGYTLRVISQSGNVISSWNAPFLFDLVSPIATGLVAHLSGEYSWYVSRWSVMTGSLISNEPLSEVTVALMGATHIFTGVQLLTWQQTWEYVFSLTLWAQHHDGGLSYAIIYKDIAGNTGMIIGSWTTQVKTSAPTITGLVFSGTTSWIYTATWNTNEIASGYISYVLSGNNTGQYVYTTWFATGFVLQLSGIQTSSTYRISLYMEDWLRNGRMISGVMAVSQTGTIQYALYQTGQTGINIIELLNSQTGYSVPYFGSILQEEIKKFTDCKSEIEFFTSAITVNGISLDLQVPLFEKDMLKRVVNAFSVLIISELKDRNLTSEQMQDFMKTYSNFFVVVKLLGDDDNSCKQNLSNYYIKQFQDELMQYGIVSL